MEHSQKQNLIQSPYLHLALVVLLSLTAYSNSFRSTFQFDDLRTIRFNFSLRDLNEWKEILHYEKFRPVLNATFALNYSIGKLKPFSYHVFNFILHVANVALFYLFLFRISRNHLFCFVSAVLMAVHPLNTESVTYVSSRSILLCSIFFFLGLLSFDAYLERPLNSLTILFFLFYCFGGLTKEEAGMMPIAALLYNFIFHGARSVRKHAIFHLSALLVLAAAVFVRLTQILTTDLPFPFFTYIATETKVVWNYIYLAIYPIRLNVDPDVASLTPLDPMFLVFALMTLFVIYVLWHYRKTHPLLTFWGLWFYLNLIPTSFIPLNDFMAEHRTYLSMFGFCACVSYLCIFIWKARTSSRWVIPVVISLLIAFYTVGTYQRNRVWSNELTLWLDAVEKSPSKIRPHLNLGAAFLQRKAYDLAVREYRYALFINPDLPQGNTGLALSYMNKNDLETAGEYFKRALEKDPESVDANVGYGMTLYRQRRYADALKYLVPELPKRQESPQVVGMIANSYLQLGKMEEAIPYLQKFIELRPFYGPAYFDLIRSYVATGRFTEAMDIYEASKNRFPPAGRNWFDLCDTLIKKRRTEDAHRILRDMAQNPKWKDEATRRLQQTLSF
jgi:protein O-mannosyl-transferase